MVGPTGIRVCKNPTCVNRACNVGQHDLYPVGQPTKEEDDAQTVRLKAEGRRIHIETTSFTPAPEWWETGTM